jgi:hypothetical protein
MKKTGISAVFALSVFALPLAAGAAYPAYPSYQAGGQQINQQMVQRMGQQIGQQVATLPSQSAQTGSMVAASPTRMTGNLPRVGSNATNAGRQYYQPADYDRLADSGLYIGLSVGYSASITGAISTDYKNEKDAFMAPGAFKTADYKTDTVIPLQLSVGAAINNDVRVDFSYSRYRGIGYPSSVETSAGDKKFATTRVTGGAITANATMLNIFYNVDSYTGYMMGGALRPYVGAGLGISMNTIADYVVLDNHFYSELDPASAPAGKLTGVSDIYAYHSGGTSEQLAYMFEGGLTTELDGGIKLDFFVKYSGMGRVKTSGSIVVKQTEWLGDGAGGEQQAPYDSVFHYTNWYESGKLSTVDVGIRMRLQF